MAKPKKTPRPKAATPKGFRDTFGAEVTARAEMLQKIAAVYHRYGFDALESSAVETVEALGKFLPDVDRPNEGVFAWQEEDGDWLALRYDMTAPLARVYAQHRNDLPSPYRRYTMGPVWRNEKPGPGRFRQFYQCDADTVGTASPAADAEICMLLCDVLEEVGIQRGEYIVRLNSRTVLNELMERVGLLNPSLPEENADKRGVASRAIDKLDRLGLDGVAQLLGSGRRDESGDFTGGAGLTQSSIDIILSVLAAADDTEKEAKALDYAKKHISSKALTERDNLTLFNIFDALWHPDFPPSGPAELLTLIEMIRDAGYGPDRIVIDPSVVRGLGYYTGPVYEAELTFDVQNEKGQTVQFGSVAGGGRYDDLVKRFTGQEVPATGVSIGVDRLLAALASKGQLSAQAEGPIVVTVMDKARMADYQAMVAELRGAGLRAEVYLGNPRNFGNQLKYADKRGAPIAIIEGGDEHAKGVVQIKDLIEGSKIAETATHEEWAENPSQVEVPRADLVAEVRKILARHA